MQFGASLSEGVGGGINPHDPERTQAGPEGNERLKEFNFPNYVNGRTSTNHFPRDINTNSSWSPLVTI